MPRPRTWAAAAAVVSLSGVLLFAGAGAAVAAPPAPPSIGQPLPGFTPDRTPDVEGVASTADQNIRVWVEHDGVETLYAECETFTSDVEFACPGAAPLSFGDNTFTAEGRYLTGPDQDYTTRGDPITITVVDQSPVVIAGPSSPTTEASPTFTGTGPAFGTVRLFETAAFGDQICEAPIAGDGTWTCTLAFALGTGDYEVTPQGSLRADEVAADYDPAPFLLTVAAPAPPPPPPPAAEPPAAPSPAFVPTVVDPEPAQVPAELIVPAQPVDPPTLSTPPPPAETTTATVTADPIAETEPVGTDRDDPAAPSAFTNALRSVPTVLAAPAALAGATVAGLALLVLVAFPAELLNSTLDSRYAGLSRRMPGAGLLTRIHDLLHRSPVVGAAVLTGVSAIVLAFADPGFGLDIVSLRLVLSCGIAMFVLGYGVCRLAAVVIHRRLRLDTTLELKPLGLALAAVGVVLSRLLDFSPGFLLGLVLGLGLVGTVSVAQRAAATMVQVAVTLVLSLLAWGGASMLMSVPLASFGEALLADTFVAVATGGLTALCVGMLPLRFLGGSTLFAFSKPLWALVFTVATALFVAIVVPASWGDIRGPFWIWVAVIGGFALVAVTVYLVSRFALPDPDRPAASHERMPEYDSVA